MYRLITLTIFVFALGCGSGERRVEVQAPPGQRGPQGPGGKDGQPGEPGKPGDPNQSTCDVSETSTDVIITCNGKTVRIPKGSDELVICVWDEQCNVKTVTAKIADINAQKYRILHLGQCFEISQPSPTKPATGC